MEIAFLLYPGMTALDFVGPHEVLCRLPGAVIRRVSKQPGPVKTDSEVQLIAECGFGYAMRPDVLVVPGAASATDMRDEPEILDWVRNAHAGTTWTTSVCTGSLILGAASVLSGLEATTHWAALDRLLFMERNQRSRGWSKQAKSLPQPVYLPVSIWLCSWP